MLGLEAKKVRKKSTCCSIWKSSEFHKEFIRFS